MARLALVAEDVDRASRGDHTWGGVVWADDLPCTWRSSCLSLVGGVVAWRPRRMRRRRRQKLCDSLGVPLNLGKWQQCNQAIWPPVPSSADAAFLQEEMSAFFSLTWDASPHGWAAVVRWWGGVDGRMALQEQLVVGSWPDEGDVTEQPNRECLAAPLALEAAAAAGCKGVVCAPPERRGGGCAKGARSQGLCSAVRFGACG